jgi:pimeloyl-ACP methyl ester carboxylesterase
MFATCDGIETYYEVAGFGPPLLLFSPGGFNATVENWRSFGIYERLGLLEALSEHFTCITYDRREAGRSGGRVEQVTWDDYAAQGAALLDHLGIRRARLLGGCIGCSCATAFAVAHPQRVARMVLYSPAGGPRYRLTQQGRFRDHLEHVREANLGGVAALARSGTAAFSQDPRVGPWATVIREYPAFADTYVRLDRDWYLETVGAMARGLFQRDTVPGPDAEELLALRVPTLVVPGHDASHATSAARYLEECLEGSEYWNVTPDEQTADRARQRLLAFLQQ